MQETGCIICNKTITNPVCLDCINHEVRDWLRDKGYELDLIEKEIYYSHIKCILCNKKMDICPHCYSKDVGLVIKEKFPKLMEEFGEVFRY